MKLFFFHCDDSTPFGRADPLTLSDQIRMELFFTPNDNGKSRKQLGGDIDDACTWAGIHCEDAAEIFQIEWQHAFVQIFGSIDFRMLPSRVRHVTIAFEDLTGEVDTAVLPESLEYFRLHKCLFYGTIDVGKIPKNVQTFYILQNNITALRDIDEIPERLQWLEIREAHIENKKVRVCKLPARKIKLTFGCYRREDIVLEDEADAGKVHSYIE